MIVIASAVLLVISGSAHQGKHRGGNGMAGRAGGGRGQQVKSRGKQEASENGKKRGRENERKRSRLPIPLTTDARSDEGADKAHN